MEKDEEKRVKKDEYKEYLDKCGVNGTILRGIVSLYEDEHKPNDPIRYLCEQWGYGLPELDEIQSLQKEVKKLRDIYYGLIEENDRLKSLTEEPVKENKYGLDDDLLEMIRKQEEEIKLIQEREACILKAYEESKVKPKSTKSPPIKEEIIIPPEVIHSEHEEEFEENANFEQEIKGEDVEDDEISKCDLLMMDDYEEDPGIIAVGESPDITSDSIDISLDEIKTHQQTECGGI